jgi:hypothetical protein
MEQLKFFGPGFSTPEMHPKHGPQAGLKEAIPNISQLTHK